MGAAWVSVKGEAGGGGVRVDVVWVSVKGEEWGDGVRVGVVRVGAPSELPAAAA